MQRPALLVLVRHGHSLMNFAKRGNIYLPDCEALELVQAMADQDIPLTDLGEQQAAMTGQVLRERFGRFDVVYDSGYVRTVATRECVFHAYSQDELARLKIRQSDRLRERDPGYTFHMTTEQADQMFPWLADYFKKFGYFFARPVGGESQAQVCDRLYTFIGTLFAQRAGQKVVMFTHGGTIRAIRYNLEKWTAADYLADVARGGYDNCSLTILSILKPRVGSNLSRQIPIHGRVACQPVSNS